MGSILLVKNAFSKPLQKTWAFQMIIVGTFMTLWWACDWRLYKLVKDMSLWWLIACSSLWWPHNIFAMSLSQKNWQAHCELTFLYWNICCVKSSNYWKFEITVQLIFKRLKNKTVESIWIINISSMQVLSAAFWVIKRDLYSP